MKRLFIAVTVTVLLLTLTTVISTAQTRIDLGFKGGLNIATASIDVIDDNESKTYFGLGACMEIHVSESFTIQPELLYMKKGTVFSESEIIEIEGVPVTVTMETESKASFLEIPVLVRISVPTEGKVSPFFIAGPAIAFTMSAKDKITLTASAMGESYSESEEVDTKDETASMDIGLVFGGGVDFLLTNFKLSLDGRYTMGMSDLADDSDYVEVKTRTFSIMVGISFPIGPK